MNPKLAPFYCGGRIFTREESKKMERDYNGPVGERVSIQLKKPFRRLIKIEEEPEADDTTVVVKDVNRIACDRNSLLSHVVGTTRYNKVRVRTRTSPRLKFFSGLAFKNKLFISPTGVLTTNADEMRFRVYVTARYSFNCVNLTDIFPSDCQSLTASTDSNTDEDDNDNDQSVKVLCVIKQKLMKKEKKYRFGNEDSAGEMFNGLSLRQAEAETEDAEKEHKKRVDGDICTLIRTRLPPELRMDILRHMNYDQVKWMADGDERFARDLANRRYRINSYDLNKFPSLSALLPALRKEAAGEMRFGPNDDLWLVSISGNKGYNTNPAVRYAVRPGVYKWHTAFSVMNIRYDVNRSYCDLCIEHLYDLQKAMAENQEQTLKGLSNMKVFALEGCENTDIDTRYVSPFFYRSAGSSSMSDHDYTVHMWTENVDNAWLQDVQVSAENLEFQEFKAFADYKTLIFKDPVKFLGTSKVMDLVDEGILALTSKLDGQVVGYLVDDEIVRLRIPQHNSAEHQPQVIGLNFVSPLRYKETRAAADLVRHVRYHEVKQKIISANERLHDLRTRLADNNIDDDDAAAVRDDIDDTLYHLHCLYQIQTGSDKLKRLDLVEETSGDNDDTVHFHEIYEDDFDFCTIYLFYKRKYLLDAEKRIARLLFDNCSYERQNPDKECTLKCINPLAVRSVYAVKTGRKLENDLKICC